MKSAPVANSVQSPIHKTIAVPLPLRIGAQIPTTTLIATPPGTLYVTQHLALVAVVHASTAAISGLVVFTDGPALLGSASVGPSGTASLVIAGLPLGTHRIVATFGGSVHLAPSVSNAGVIAINPLPPSPVITCAPVQALVQQGASDQIVATASSSAGRVLHIGFTTTAGSLTVAGANAVLHTGGANPGLVTVTCKATDDLGQTATDSTNITVQAPITASSTSLVVSPTTTVAGETVTLSARIATGAIAPQGSVRFSDGASTLAVVPISSSSATLAVSLPQGTHPITATYLGSTASSPSTSAAVPVTVQPQLPTISCVASPAVVYPGQTSTITANAAGAAGLPFTVAFSAPGGTIQATGAVAQLTAGPTAGTMAVNCTVTDQLGRSATAVANLAILAKIDTVASIAPIASPIMLGTPVRLVATISASAPVVGNVIFLDGSTSLGTVAVGSSGQAQLAVSALKAGSHTLSVSFAGSDSLNASRSAGSTLVVAAPAAPTVSCTASPSSINAGDAAQITASASASPERTVAVSFQSNTGSLSGQGNTATWQSNGSSTGQMENIVCTATDDLGQSTSAHASVWVNENQGEAAHTAYSFTDSVGVNVHLHFGGTPYVDNFEGVKASMIALGVRHYRNGVDPYALPWEYANAESLAAAGIKADWLIDGNDTPANINQIYANAPNSIEAFEGPNEDNSQAGPYLTAFMQMLHDTVRGNPNTAHVPIINFTLTDATLMNRQGDFSQEVDYANTHDYYFPRQPETPAYGGNFWNCGGYGSMSFNLCVSQVNAQNRPTISTETGYISGTQSDAVLGRYISRTLLKHIAMNVTRTYLYEMAENIYSPGYGLIRGDLTPKPAYTAVQSLIRFFQDRNFTAPGKLDYVLGGQTSNLEHVLFQKQDGTFVLALWLGVTSANPVFPYETYTVIPQNVAVDIRTPTGSSSISFLGDDGTLTTQPNISGSSFTLPVTDRVTLISLPPVAN